MTTCGTVLRDRSIGFGLVIVFFCSNDHGPLSLERLWHLVKPHPRFRCRPMITRLYSQIVSTEILGTPISGGRIPKNIHHTTSPWRYLCRLCLHIYKIVQLYFLVPRGYVSPSAKFRSKGSNLRVEMYVSFMGAIRPKASFSFIQLVSFPVHSVYPHLFMIHSILTIVDEVSMRHWGFFGSKSLLWALVSCLSRHLFCSTR